MITFSCPCGKQLAAKEEHAGKQTACPACGKHVMIPETSGPAALAPGQMEDAPERERSPATKSPRDLEDDAPRRRPGDDDDDRGRPARRRDDDDDDARGAEPRRRRYEDDEDADRDRPRRRTSEAPTSSAAVTSLVFGIISFLCPLIIPNLVAIITGIIGLVAAGQGKKGKGMAIAGLVLGAVTLLCIPIQAALLLPAIQKVREAASTTQSMNNLKQIGIAMHSYNDTYKKLPQAAIFGKNGEPLLSWRVAILPYIEQNHLYEQFKLDEPWDSPNNSRLLNQMPKIYHHPSSTADEKSMTHYQVFVADKNERPGPPFRLDKDFNISVAAFIDGTSNTILVTEASNPVPWSKPEDIPFPFRGGTPALGVNGDSFNVLMGDASTFRKSFRLLNPESLRLAVMMDDNMALPADW